MLEYKFLTTGTVVFNQNLSKVALVLRPPNKAFPNKLGLPGGKVQVDEKFIDAAQREVLEEIGLRGEDFFLFSGIYESSGYLLINYFTITDEDKVSFDYWHHLPLSPKKLAPNVLVAIEDALEKAERLVYGKRLDLVKEILSESTGFVADNIKNIEDEFGWDHFLLKNRIGIIGTAIGARILLSSNTHKNSTALENSLITISNKVNSDGGWPTKTISKSSVLESTCYCISAFLESKNSNFDRLVENGINWVVLSVNDDNGWGSTKNSKKSRILTTTMALDVLWRFDQNRFKKLINNGVDWLMSKQNQDGSWGIYGEDETGTIAHTARSIILLLDIGYSTSDSPIIKGLRWIIDKYSITGLWMDCSELEYLEIMGEESQRLEFKHSSTPLALRALIRSGEKISNVIMIRELGRIIEEGTRLKYWNHSLTPGHIPIWNSMEYIFLLDEINKSSINQVSILLTGKEEGIEKNGIIDSLFAFITKNKEVFTKESVDDDIEISSKKQKTGKEIKKEVKQHIAKNNLSAAISILIEYFSDEKVNADELNELFIHSGKLEHLKAQKRIGVISNEDFVNSNSKLANNLLNFTDNSL